MAYFLMTKVGEPITCNEPCGHGDCRQTREMAATPCDSCGQIIGEGEAFLFISTEPLVIRHTRCHVV